MTPLDRIRALAIWQGHIEVTALDGGTTNRNFTVRDAARKAVVRIGADIPVHQIMRFKAFVRIGADIPVHQIMRFKAFCV